MANPIFKTGENVTLEFQKADLSWCFLCGRENSQITFNNGNIQKVLQDCDDPTKLVEYIKSTIDRVEINGDGSVTDNQCFKDFLQLVGPGTAHTAPVRFTISGIVTFEGTYVFSQLTFSSPVEDVVTFGFQAALNGALTTTYA